MNETERGLDAEREYLVSRLMESLEDIEDPDKFATDMAVALKELREGNPNPIAALLPMLGEAVRLTEEALVNEKDPGTPKPGGVRITLRANPELKDITLPTGSSQE